MAILFDLDGTLLDTSRDLYNAASLVFAAEKLPSIDYPTFRSHISFGAKRVLDAVLPANLLTEEERKAYLEYLMPMFLSHYRDTKFSNTHSFDGIEDLLSTLEAARITWGIVTNKSQALTEPLLQQIGYLQRSACVVCGDTTSKSKPHPEPLLYACDLIQAKPQDCIYIGDAVTDVQAGKAAGMRTIAAGFGFIPDDVSPHDWQADALVHSPAEILPWVRAWFPNTL
jgi:N-acetyl-D-muramate 6-phosphate phosphatase